MLATPNQSSPTVSSQKITRGHSCVLCQQRKVKCDRQKPCSNCIKARAECIPSAPTVPRRRRRKFTEQDLSARLKKYEYLLKKHGVKVEDDEPNEEKDDSIPYVHVERACLSMGPSPPRDPKHSQGILFKDRNNSRYVENTLWENLRDEIDDPKEALQTSSEDELNDNGKFPAAENFLVGHSNASKDLSSLHPQPVHIFRLWQTFLTNCNPLIKIFHAPTVQQIVLDASGDLKEIPRPVEALMFSIYLMSIISLDGAQCETMFAEQRGSLISKYSRGFQQALINAKFMKSLNIMTLQAFALFLLASRKAYDPHSLWILTGTAVRIGQRLGIHRDSHSHQMSPFESEIRRRTWWQIVFLDGQASKLAGAGFPAWLAKFDTRLPLNISDSDLSPTMKESPIEKEGATEMLFCSLRYEVAEALRKSGTFVYGSGEGSWHVATGPELIAEKDRAIDELEARFERKYIRYCDPSIPLHLLCIYMSQSVICTMRVMAHHPRQYPDKGASMPQKEKDMVFSESLKGLEIASMGHARKEMKGFLWHTRVHFQLDAFIYILSELRFRTQGEMVDRAWKQVEQAYTDRPEMIKETRNALFFAMGNLCIKAWKAREEAGGLYQGTQLTAPPRFISILRSQRRIPEPPAQTQSQSQNQTQHLPHQPPAPNAAFRSTDPYTNSNRLIDFATGGPSEHTHYVGGPDAAENWNNVDFGYDMEMPEITPVDWAYWQTLMDGELPGFSADVDMNLDVGFPNLALAPTAGWIG